MSAANALAQEVWDGNFDSYLTLVEQVRETALEGHPLTAEDLYLEEVVVAVVAEGAIDLEALREYLVWDLLTYAVSCESFATGSKTYDSVCLELAEGATSRMEEGLGMAAQNKLAIDAFDVRYAICHRAGEYQTDGFEWRARDLIEAAAEAPEYVRATFAPLAQASVEQVAALLREGAERSLRSYLEGPVGEVTVLDAQSRVGASRLFRLLGSDAGPVTVALPIGVMQVLARAEMLDNFNATVSLDGEPVSIGEFQRRCPRGVPVQPAPSVRRPSASVASRGM